ncbi:hypothetical protein [Chryseobacterium sp.]|uniref:hypothetical protein n=1 Tax=Chryseobacterium sp. TaxID=1871047 RepID=UPI0026295927|nr:hypothetical protein [Chryseobacterium sp.]
MEISGTVIKIFDEVEKDGFKERIIRIHAIEKDQILDIYCFNKLSFKSGFLRLNEKVTFSIILRGITNGEKQETQIVLKKPIKPNLALTQDHPFVDREWIRVDDRTPTK